MVSKHVASAQLSCACVCVCVASRQYENVLDNQSFSHSQYKDHKQQLKDEEGEEHGSFTQSFDDLSLSDAASSSESKPSPVNVEDHTDCANLDEWNKSVSLELVTEKSFRIILRSARINVDV